MSQKEEALSGALQENILTLLVFSDEHCKVIRASVGTPKLFGSAPFREIAAVAIDFIDQYGEAIKDHLPDQLEDILNGDDKRKATTYKRILENMLVSKDAVNSQYVLSQLKKFVRLQHLKSGLADTVEALQAGRVEEAEAFMEKAMKARTVSFSPGLSLSNPSDLAHIFEHPENEGFPLGIPEFDRKGIYPRRKETFCLVAPRKRGKSWFLVHVAKQAMLARWRVLIVTLELTEEAFAVRMLQSFFSITRKQATVQVTRLRKDRDGGLEGFLQESLERDAITDPDKQGRILQRAKREFRRRPEIRIKGFPMQSLTRSEFEAYLDELERSGFVPDAILMDYPRIMKFDPKMLRIELGQVFAWFRGLMQDRNAAGIFVHQGNRVSETAAVVTSDMAEEDISLVAAVDASMTFSQTKAEKKLGLARLMADYVRNAEMSDQVLITQSYALGQFCLDSIRIGSAYWDLVKDKEERSERGERRRRHDGDEGDDAYGDQG